MKNYILYSLALLMLSACSNNECVRGSGKQASENRTVDLFSSVKTKGSIKLVLRQNPVQSVKITADDNLLEKIRTVVKRGRLLIDFKDNICDSGPVTVYLDAAEFRGLELSGSSDVVSQGRISSPAFELNLSGNSKINLDLTTGRLATNSSGSSEIRLKGQAGSHHVELSGSSKIDAADFVVGNYHIQSSGSSNCLINVLNELKVESSGSSSIAYRGKPAKVEHSESGSSSLRNID